MSYNFIIFCRRAAERLFLARQFSTAVTDAREKQKDDPPRLTTKIRTLSLVARRINNARLRIRANARRRAIFSRCNSLPLPRVAREGLAKGEVQLVKKILSYRMH